MTATLAHICRHPIKSIGWEMLAATELAPGHILPYDRHWAVAHDAAKFEGKPDGWYAKQNFVRGVAAPGLMAIEAQLGPDGHRISLSHPTRGHIEIDPDSAEGSHALLDWIEPLWPDTRPPARGIVSLSGRPMTDVPDPYIAVLSLNSLRDLGHRMHHDLSIHRFRGNLWIEGLEPWKEFDWIGREITIGQARLRIETRITRCNATKVNPATGVEDADTLRALETAFGHRDFGVYASVIDGGVISLDDPVALV